MALSSASLALLFAGCERSLIYFPTRASEEHLQEVARRQGLHPWRNEQGERVGWKTQTGSSPERASRALVVFHGNAGNATDRGYFARGIAAATRDDPWAVFVFEYPGYGSRPGKPSESAIMATARSAVESLLTQPFDALYLAGESLGSGVACDVAAALPKRIDGLILITPFTSMIDLARHHYPGWMVRALLSERYDNVEALSRYQGPVAVLLAGEDEVVPTALGRQLFTTYRGPKKLWVQEGRTHNTLDFAAAGTWWREVTQFLLDAKGDTQPSTG